MGTRSLVHMKEDGKTLVTIYRQFDGYPTGMGQDIKTAIGNLTLVNGFGGDRDDVANGMGCLSATLIRKLKTGIGNVYIYPVDSFDVGEEYVYTISDVNGTINIQCREDGSQTDIYNGPLKDWYIKE